GRIAMAIGGNSDCGRCDVSAAGAVINELDLAIGGIDPNPATIDVPVGARADVVAGEGKALNNAIGIVWIGFPNRVHGRAKNPQSSEVGICAPENTEDGPLIVAEVV